MLFIADEIASGVDAEEDEKQNRESPQRRPSVAEERQRDSDDGGQSEHHSYIYKYMEEKYAQYAVAIYSSEAMRLSFCKTDES